MADAGVGEGDRELGPNRCREWRLGLQTIAGADVSDLDGGHGATLVTRAPRTSTRNLVWVKVIPRG
jgi:hypothetical protein